MGASVLGDFVIKLGQRIAKSPAVVADPQLAALALVAMIERSNYYAISGQMGNGKRRRHRHPRRDRLRRLFGAEARSAHPGQITHPAGGDVWSDCVSGV